MIRMQIVTLIMCGLAAVGCKKTEPTSAQPEQTPSTQGDALALPDLPSGHVAGTLELPEELRDKVSAGDVIFVMARHPVNGSIVAVRKMEAPEKFPLEFRLEQEHVMMHGRSLAGQVLLSARVDKDGDAMSRGPGDVLAELAEPVTVPAEGVRLELNKVME